MITWAQKYFCKKHKTPEVCSVARRNCLIYNTLRTIIIVPQTSKFPFNYHHEAIRTLRSMYSGASLEGWSALKKLLKDFWSQQVYLSTFMPLDKTSVQQSKKFGPVVSIIKRFHCMWLILQKNTTAYHCKTAIKFTC